MGRRDEEEKERPRKEMGDGERRRGVAEMQVGGGRGIETVVA